jgi:hypothetical protein
MDKPTPSRRANSCVVGKSVTWVLRPDFPNITLTGTFGLLRPHNVIREQKHQKSNRKCDTP